MTRANHARTTARAGPFRACPGLALTLGLAAAPALAATPVPDPSPHTVPDCVMLLPGAADGHANGLVQSYQPFTVVIRDFALNPLPGVTVRLDFSLEPDVRLAQAQTAGLALDCSGSSVARTTDAQGVATFLVRGAGRNSLPAGGAGAGGFDRVRVYAENVLIKFVTAVTPDQNGAGATGTVATGIDPTDVVFFLTDLFYLSTTAGRSDLDCDGAVDPGDLSILLDFLFNDGASAAPQATTFCP